jgi:RHS repeat-associated protein
MTAKAESSSTVTAFAYDAADRLTAITPASGNAATFTLDALGRFRTRTVGGATDTYAYLGTTETAYEIANASGTTDSVVDQTGARAGLRTGAGSAAWYLFDLHGDAIGLENGAKAITDAYRFDGYGVTVAASGTSTNAWRYQGRLDISPSPDPLYDAGARFYAPSLGTFTQADTTAGSAQDPASMNRYLYTAANPATLIDPDGHAYCGPDGILCGGGGTSHQTVAKPRHHAPRHHAPTRRRARAQSSYIDAIGHERGRAIIRRGQASHHRTVSRAIHQIVRDDAGDAVGFRNGKRFTTRTMASHHQTIHKVDIDAIGHERGRTIVRTGQASHAPAVSRADDDRESRSLTATAARGAPSPGGGFDPLEAARKWVDWTVNGTPLPGGGRIGGLGNQVAALDAGAHVIIAVGALSEGDTGDAEISLEEAEEDLAAVAARASTPTGQKGVPLTVTPGTNAPSVISGRQYWGHAIDSMQSDNIPPSVVEDTLENGTHIASGGRVIHYSQWNNVSVVTLQDGTVVTVSYGALKVKP